MSSLEMLYRGGGKAELIEMMGKKMQTKVGVTMLQTLAQVRVQLQLNSQQAFRFIPGHQVQSPVLPRPCSRWAVAQQEGSRQTGTSPAVSGTWHDLPAETVLVHSPR